MITAFSINRLKTLFRRRMVAQRLGLIFTGTSHFRLPKMFSYHGRNISIESPPDRGLAYDFMNVILDDEYGLRKINEQPKVIYDIGGNIGLFAIWAALNFPEAKIESFEPHPETFQFLSKNMSQFVGCAVRNVALGSKNGLGFISSNTESRSNRVSSDAAREEKSGHEIQIVAFEELVAAERQEIDLLKIDCEGAEWDIFEDAAPFQKVRMIRMEYHLVDGKTLEDLKRAADRIGFEIVKLEENSGFGIAWMEKR